MIKGQIVIESHSYLEYERTVKSTNKKRKEWISDNTWKTIEERRILKNKENSAHSIIKSREKERN